MAYINGKEILFSATVEDGKASELQEDIDNINQAFEDYGVEVGDTPSEEYGSLIDEAMYNSLTAAFGHKTDFNMFFANIKADGTKLPAFDTSKSVNFYAFCYESSGITHIPSYDYSKLKGGTGASGFYSAFYKTSGLKTVESVIAPICINVGNIFMQSGVVTIGEIDISSATSTSNAFSGCYKLENITFRGSIIASLDFRQSSKLTVESLLSIINALQDLTGQDAKTLYIGSTNKAKLTEEQRTIAENKNWILS